MIFYYWIKLIVKDGYSFPVIKYICHVREPHFYLNNIFTKIFKIFIFTKLLNAFIKYLLKYYY